IWTYAKEHSCTGGGGGESLYVLQKCMMLFLSLQCYKVVCHLNMLAVAFGVKILRQIINRSESRRLWVFICVSNFFNHIFISFSATQCKFPFLVTVLLVLKQFLVKLQ
ncbi:hypothetical protein N321_07685, partial [Antrostomus carolinensis]